MIVSSIMLRRYFGKSGVPDAIHWRVLVSFNVLMSRGTDILNFNAYTASFSWAAVLLQENKKG